MKNKRKILAVMVTGIVIIMAACESSNEQSTKISDEQEKSNIYENKDETKGSIDIVTENSKENENAGDHEVAEQTEKKPSETKGNIQITNGDEAVQFLMQQLKEGNDDNISFGTDGKLEIDNNGSYYMIQLVDIPLRVSGKTGSLGYYKVYQDGTYELFQLTSSDSDKEFAKNVKEEYLKKLHDIEKEMEELLENSEATTTLEMEEEIVYGYKTWDAELNEIYGTLKEQLSKEQMEKLREEQRDWIKHRDEVAKETSLKFKGGSIESLEYVAKQAALTKERCYELIANYMK
ncbi:lysozyme inhibitor LprI family protein [Evansella sp. AB-rgal1]|uniref:lysozyme inhibitor LprI family protein n=1 Tax=Evansella sp. AB-rgal1 TaxID=3242696 RepID=UPI00359F0EDB